MSSKLKEAVSRLVREIEDGMLVEVSSKFECDLAKTLLVDVKSALAEPPRNCDVGTPQEQIKRWEKFCQEHHEYWKPGKSLTAIQRCNCPCHEGNGCNYFIWAQMPYEEVK
jgi:hypothetical protein